MLDRPLKGLTFKRVATQSTLPLASMRFFITKQIRGVQVVLSETLDCIGYLEHALPRRYHS